MKIEFDIVAQPYAYPISAAEVKRVLAHCAPPEILHRVSKLRFGCNQQTTQEARIVGRGTNFEIRVNFCLRDGKTILLSENRGWCETVEACGGVADKKSRLVSWTPTAAKKYAVYLIAHEIAHIVYAEKHGSSSFKGRKSSCSEESWCENFARDLMATLPALA